MFIELVEKWNKNELDCCYSIQLRADFVFAAKPPQADFEDREVHSVVYLTHEIEGTTTLYCQETPEEVVKKVEDALRPQYNNNR